MFNGKSIKNQLKTKTMKKSILRIAFVALLIPIGLISCKNNNTRTDRSNSLDARENTTTRDAEDAWDHATDKVEEKANRLVGNYEKALEKARDRLQNAEEEIRKAITDGNADAEARARENKRDIEKEIQELQDKIRQENRP